MSRSVTRSRCVSAAGLVVMLALVIAACRPVPSFAPPGGPIGSLRPDGRWLVDATGRVVSLHGVNFVQKFPPVAPATVGFGADDARFLREQGLNVVRLGVVFGAVMPEPGVIDDAYVASIAETVRVLAHERIFTLVDWHQDGYGPLVHGNGFPEWATLTDGLANPPDPFPTYYVTNPALQRAFDNFWANAPGPDGVPLQEHYAAAVRAVAAALASNPFVVGYDTMNEPWPGADWSACATGCPDAEAERLGPFDARMTAAIRSVDRGAIVFNEPFVLFNFGRSDTSIGTAGSPRNGLSFHVYATSPADDESVMDRAVSSSTSTGAALLATEFGATTDRATIERLTGAFDTRHLPWVFWSYDGNVIPDLTKPPSPANLHDAVVLGLSRPYAIATNGTPATYAYDPATGSMESSWATTRPDGRRAAVGLTSTIVVPPRAYPTGYRVAVTGGTVVSEPCAPLLEVRNDPRATSVVVRLTRDACATRP